MKHTDTRRLTTFNISDIIFLGKFALIGATAGAAILHPLVLSLFWLEFSDTLEGSSGYLEFIQNQIQKMIGPSNLKMGAIFAAIGAVMGIGFSLVARTLSKRESDIRLLSEMIGESIPDLIEAGEGARVEFKSTARWDVRNDKANKALETVIAKTIVGFLNARGGNLIIGVTDNGEIYGLEKDYGTLRQKDRDGFEQLLMDIVKRFVGADACALVHTLISEVEGKDVCLVRVEPALRPVYLTQSGKSEFYLRTGNATRALDARETIDYASKHWAK